MFVVVFLYSSIKFKQTEERNWQYFDAEAAL